jgi:anti-anti-sigma factor
MSSVDALAMSDLKMSDEVFARNHLALTILETDPSRGLLVAALKGELDIATLALCRTDLSSALNLFGHRQATWIILDLSECTYLDSTGLGVFVSLMKTARASGGDAVFVSPPAPIRRVFEVTQMTQILTVVDTLEQATALIGADGIEPVKC